MENAEKSLPVLYTFRRCPYAMRARMAIVVSGARVELREVLLKDKPEAMLAASQKGTVPVLVRDLEPVIDESIDVMRWALGTSDPEGWVAPDLEAQLALIAENDGDFKHHLDRYKYSTRYEDADPDEHRAAGVKFLEKLEARLTAEKCLFGPNRALADIAIFPFVRQFRIADEKWFDAQAPMRVRAWLTELMESDLFKSVMTKYDVWKPGRHGVVFGAG